MILYMCLIETLVKACTISEILAQTDHKGPNWNFLTLKMTFSVIPYLSYFRIGLVSHSYYFAQKLYDSVFQTYHRTLQL